MISFHCDTELFNVIPEPFPAHKAIPAWLRNMAPTIEPDTVEAFPLETVKRCLPILDAYSAGYIIPTPYPVRFVVENGVINCSWRPGPDSQVVSFHTNAQVDTAAGWGQPLLKWTNLWSITTPPNYSCLFIPPVNQSNDVLFRCFAGVVDTDNYENTINFPFAWLGPPNYDGIIEAGTPMVQVIPFRREAWTSEVRPRTDDEELEMKRTRNRVTSRFGGYRDKSRTRKVWR